MTVVSARWVNSPYARHLITTLPYLRLGSGSLSPNVPTILRDASVVLAIDVDARYLARQLVGERQQTAKGALPRGSQYNQCVQGQVSAKSIRELSKQNAGKKT